MEKAKCGISGCGYLTVSGSSFCSDHQPGQRPKTSQAVIDIITQLVDSQDEKGMKNYGVTIDDAKDSDYNWNLMGLEECVDGMKYLIKEIRRLENELRQQKKLNRDLVNSILSQL